MSTNLSEASKPSHPRSVSAPGPGRPGYPLTRASSSPGPNQPATLSYSLPCLPPQDEAIFKAAPALAQMLAAGPSTDEGLDSAEAAQDAGLSGWMIGAAVPQASFPDALPATRQPRDTEADLLDAANTLNVLSSGQNNSNVSGTETAAVASGTVPTSDPVASAGDVGLAFQSSLQQLFASPSSQAGLAQLLASPQVVSLMHPGGPQASAGPQPDLPLQQIFQEVGVQGGGTQGEEAAAVVAAEAAPLAAPHAAQPVEPAGLDEDVAAAFCALNSIQGAGHG